MNKRKFLIFLMIGTFLFFSSPYISAVIEHHLFYGFYAFVFKSAYFTPAFLLLFCSFFSLITNAFYLIVKGDSEIRNMVKNMFSFFIWDELLDD